MFCTGHAPQHPPRSTPASCWPPPQSHPAVAAMHLPATTATTDTASSPPPPSPSPLTPTHSPRMERLTALRHGPPSPLPAPAPIVSRRVSAIGVPVGSRLRHLTGYSPRPARLVSPRRALMWRSGGGGGEQGGGRGEDGGRGVEEGGGGGRGRGEEGRAGGGGGQDEGGVGWRRRDMGRGGRGRAGVDTAMLHICAAPHSLAVPSVTFCCPSLGGFFFACDPRWPLAPGDGTVILLASSFLLECKLRNHFLRSVTVVCPLLKSSLEYRADTFHCE